MVSMSVAISSRSLLIFFSGLILLGCSSTQENSSADIQPDADSAVTNKEDITPKQLEPVLSSIYLIYTGLGHPHNKQRLEACQQQQEQDCLAAYEKSRNGKQTLLAYDRQKVLPLLLQHISLYCDADEQVQSEALCFGALGALYWFNGLEEDQQILAYFKTLPVSVHRKILNTSSEFIYNRPDPEAWIFLLRELSIKGLDDVYTDWLEDKFNQSINEQDYFGTMLL